MPLAGSPAAAAIVTALVTAGPLSRVALARRLGLSSAAVTKAARPLIDDGYLRELGATERTGAGAGRPASPLAMRPDREFFAGIKLTGDELIGVVCDLTATVRVVEHRPLHGAEVEHVVGEIAAMTRDLAGWGARRLGLAVSGDVDRASGLVRYSPFLRWHDVTLGKLVAAATGLTVTVENDVKALTTAEHWFGEGAGADSFALVTVGSGIGCGLVVNGRLVSGSHGVAGEIGHLSVDTAGPDCHCGSRGCVEAIAGTEPIVVAARAATGRADLSIDDAYALARAGDAAVAEVFARAGDAIGLGIAAVANLVGPARIVVSGEGLAAYDLFEPHIRAGFERQAFGAAAEIPLSIRPLPFEEWARGAAAVSIQSRLVPLA